MTCFNLTDGYERCFACVQGQGMLDALAPISYSVAHERLHHALAGYKRDSGGAARLVALELAAILWRYLDGHERCLARHVGADSFQLVTTVPSGDRHRDQDHPLRWIVGELVAPTRDRYERILRRSAFGIEHRAFDYVKYLAVRSLDGEAVLLIDDTWTTGSSAQSAAYALKAAGASVVAAVVIGRHVNREWHENDERLRRLRERFDWNLCALCAPQRTRSPV